MPRNTSIDSLLRPGHILKQKRRLKIHPTTFWNENRQTDAISNDALAVVYIDWIFLQFSTFFMLQF